MSTRIRSIDAFALRLPFDHGAPAPLFAGRPRHTLDSLLVRVALDNGLVGWGEAYGGELSATAALLRHRVAPLALGQDAADPGWPATLERTLHNLGRSGVLLHALSGLDIALWDLRGKLAGQPLSVMLGGPAAPRVEAYASLLQYYGDGELVRRNTQRALEAGHRQVKLHERTLAAVRAARREMGPALPLMVDTNCAWDLSAAEAAMQQMAECEPAWVEEPIWPPERTEDLAALRVRTGLSVAAGENASSLHELLTMVDRRQVDVVQPCAIKSGGVSTLLAVAKRCAGTPVRCSPQAAFFGPGFLATLHVLAACAPGTPVERLFCDLGATPYARSVPVGGGYFQLTDAPGLGADPEPELLGGPFVQSA